MHDEGRRPHPTQHGDAARTGLDGDELAGEAVRAKAAAYRPVDLRPELGVSRRIARPSDQPEEIVHPAGHPPQTSEPSRVVTVPLVVVTVLRAWRRQWDKHRTLALWTFPIWLYVSVTGVLIYLMLYQMAHA